jgi:hypothetical protein
MENAMETSRCLTEREAEADSRGARLSPSLPTNLIPPCDKSLVVIGSHRSWAHDLSGQQFRLLHDELHRSLLLVRRIAVLRQEPPNVPTQ